MTLAAARLRLAQARAELRMRQRRVDARARQLQAGWERWRVPLLAAAGVLAGWRIAQRDDADGSHQDRRSSSPAWHQRLLPVLPTLLTTLARLAQAAPPPAAAPRPRSEATDP